MDKKIVDSVVGPKAKVFAEALLDHLESNQFSLEMEYSDMAANDPGLPALEEQLKAIDVIQQLALKIYKLSGLSVEEWDRPEDWDEFNDYWAKELKEE